MRKGLTEGIFILDRNGFMRGLGADTIGGADVEVTVIKSNRKTVSIQVNSEQ